MPLTADPYVIVDPSIMIDTTEFQCATNTATLEYVYAESDDKTFCKPNATTRTLIGCTLSVDIKLSFGDGGSFNLLHAMGGLRKVVVVKALDAAAAVGNPSTTFTAEIPFIPAVTEMKIGESMVLELELISDAAPVVALA